MINVWLRIMMQNSGEGNLEISTLVLTVSDVLVVALFCSFIPKVCNKVLSRVWDQCYQTCSNNILGRSPCDLHCISALLLVEIRTAIWRMKGMVRYHGPPQSPQYRLPYCVNAFFFLFFPYSTCVRSMSTELATQYLHSTDCWSHFCCYISFCFFVLRIYCLLSRF